VATALADTIRRFNVCKKTATHTFKALDGISGTLRGGELALIMAPPGHGQ
jgi:ABC-type multidrug transport system ATPase subunit